VGDTFAIFCALLCLTYGFVCVCWPRRIWEFNLRGTVKSGEPSRRSLYVYRGWGIILIIAALVFLIGTAVYSY
jgi:hypothetical protein